MHRPVRKPRRPPPRPPTGPQLDALRAIAGAIERNGQPPTLRELAAALGTTLRAAVCRVAGLLAKGLVRRRPHMARGLRLTDKARRLLDA